MITPNPRDDRLDDPDDPSIESAWTAAVKQIEAIGKPEKQIRLLDEALHLLDDADRDLVKKRLSDCDDDDLAAELETENDAASPFAAAIDRFADRLAWIVEQRGRGYSPPERAALGRKHFFGESERRIADRLRLPIEAVTHWINSEANER